MNHALAIVLLLATGLAHADPVEPEPGPQPERIQRWAQPPLVVPPPIIEPPKRAPSPLPGALPPPPVAIERPLMPSACDINGCWSNNGTHLNRVAPACLLQAGVLVCR